MFSCSAVFLPPKGNDEQRLHLGILSSLMLETHLAFGKRDLRQAQNVSNGHHLHKDSSTTLAVQKNAEEKAKLNQNLFIHFQWVCVCLHI